MAQTHALRSNRKKAVTEEATTRWATSYLTHFAVKPRCRGFLCTSLCTSLHRPLKRQQHLGLFTITLKNFSLQHLTTQTVNSIKTLFQTFWTILGVTLTLSHAECKQSFKNHARYLVRTHLSHVKDILRSADGLQAELAEWHQAFDIVVETNYAAKIFDADDVTVGYAARASICKGAEQRQGAFNQGLLSGQI